MRILVILALATLLTGCNGDSIKDSMNAIRAQPQTGLKGTPGGVIWLSYATDTQLDGHQGA